MYKWSCVHCIKRLSQELPPLVPALQSGYYELIWEKCADLPSPLYHASVALHDNKVYTMAGDAPDNDTNHHVYVYDINSNQWDRLPPPGQYMGTLQIIDSKLTIIGGKDNTTRKSTNKVATYNNKSWNNYYPAMVKARNRSGALAQLDYVIVLGGVLDDYTLSDDIEVLNYKQSSHWVIARMKLPEPMWDPSLTISDDLLYIVGYDKTTGRTRAAHQIPVGILTSSKSQLTSNETTHWTKLAKAPHGSTAIIPNSCPPVIIGGYDKQAIPMIDIRVLDVPNNSWRKIASLTTARASTAVISINHDSILVIGGHTGGRGPEGALAHSITTVEKGYAIHMQ